MSAIAVNPVTDTVYVTLWAANLTEIAVVNGHTNQLIKRIKVPAAGFLDDNRRGHRGQQGLCHLPGAAYRIGSTVPPTTTCAVSRTCPGPRGIAVRTRRDHVMHVACFYDNDLSVLSTATGKQLATVPTGSAPFDNVYSGHAIYEINSGTEGLWAISTPR